ncbi:MAG TPA: hypothetical protein VJ652_15070 [Noviherbaspirillum sp.]|nr:hypothetical protein [Noviherbaspirillum sp.]
MTELDSFFPIIRQYAPGVADLSAAFGVRQAAIEFCERTRLWRYEDEFDVTDDEDLLCPSGAVIHEIETIRFNDGKLEPATTQYLDRAMPDWRTETQTSNPRYYTQTAPDTLRLVPRCSGHVNVYLWLKPSQDCDELPDFIGDKYRETIAHGALSRILLIPNQSFTSGDLAGAFGASFQSKLDSLSTKGSTGQQRARARVRGTFF